MKSTKTVLAVAIVIAGMVSFGCSGVSDVNVAGGGGPTLPSPSSIPLGIYSGRLDLNGTVWVNGVPTPFEESTGATVVFDESGRLLDADGAPVFVGGEYVVDGGSVFLELYARSITVIDNSILVRYDLTVYAEFGTSEAEMTGIQTSKFTFDAVTGTLTVVNTQQYSGIASDGVSLLYLTDGNAILERG